MLTTGSPVMAFYSQRLPGPRWEFLPVGVTEKQKHHFLASCSSLEGKSWQEGFAWVVCYLLKVSLCNRLRLLLWSVLSVQVEAVEWS